jgi:hypothetical protein
MCQEVAFTKERSKAVLLATEVPELEVQKWMDLLWSDEQKFELFNSKRRQMYRLLLIIHFFKGKICSTSSD